MTGCLFLVADCWLRVAGCGLCWLRVEYNFLVACFWLRVACCVLLVAYCWLRVAGCWLRTTVRLGPLYVSRADPSVLMLFWSIVTFGVEGFTRLWLCGLVPCRAFQG